MLTSMRGEINYNTIIVGDYNTPGEGNGTPLQYSCLENPMDGEAWKAAVHGVAEGRTRLSDFTFMHWRRKWQPTSVFLPGKSQGRWSLVGCRLWGRTESDTTEATLAAAAGGTAGMEETSSVTSPRHPLLLLLLSRFSRVLLCPAP